MVVPTAILVMGVHTHFFRDVPWDLEFRLMFSDGGILVEESR